MKKLLTILVLVGIANSATFSANKMVCDFYYPKLLDENKKLERAISFGFKNATKTALENVISNSKTLMINCKEGSKQSEFATRLYFKYAK